MIKVQEMDATPIVGPWRLPRGWEWVPLGNICTINPVRPRLNRSIDAPTSFIPMTNVDETLGVVKEVEIKSYAEVTRGFTYFEENDILFAKITPSMQNGKCAIAHGLIDGLGFGSTEFHVLRSNHQVIPEWIYYFLRRIQFRLEAKEHFLGAVGQQRVPADFLAISLIPLPLSLDLQLSLDIQNRIVDRIESFLTDLREAQETLESMRQDIDQVMDGVLLEVFNETVTRNWSSRLPLGKLVEIPARQVDPRLPNYRYLPHIGGENIEARTCRLGSFRTAEEDQIISSNYLFEPGVILYSKIRPYLRKVTFVNFKGLCSADIYPLSVVSDKLLPRFLMWLLVAPPFTEFAVAKSGRARMPKINRSELFSYELPFPSKTEQQHIINYLDSIQEGVDELQNMVNEDAEILQQVEDGILNQAFRGEL